jgi:hypothetical protein
VRITTFPLRIVAAKRPIQASYHLNRNPNTNDKMPDIKRWVKLITHQKPMYVYCAQPRVLALPTRHRDRPLTWHEQWRAIAC